MNQLIFLKMKKIIHCIILPVFIVNSAFMTSCNDDDNAEANPSAEELRLREGYLVVSGLDGSTFVQYYDELPSGTIDITQGADFQSFGAASVINSIIYTESTDGSNGFQKIVVSESGDLQVVGEITSVGGIRGLSVRDSLFGVFRDLNDATITTFNPTTMEVTGSIDMSILSELGREEGDVTFAGFAFRGENEMIVALDAVPRLPGAPRAIVDLGAMRATSITTFVEANLLNPPIITIHNHFDENGNYYGPNFSSEGLPSISATILKIPTGQSEYDQSYNFQVPLQNNPDLALGGALLTSFEYFANDIGYAGINGSLDPRIIEILFVENGGEFANIDQNELDEIITLLISSPTAIMTEINMVTQQITKVEGLPTFNPFGGAAIIEIHDEIHFIIRSDEVNGMYRNLGGGSAELVFEGTGANLSTVIDLSQDYQ